ncbi:MAG: chemotaxis protein CheW [Desulfobacterales bacterium]|nr:chemotaxis protein CheW [Desulfobacterales bacterium]
MDKTLREEDLKLLEDEIDSAVNRLFVAKQGEAAEGSSVESPLVGPSSRVGESPEVLTTPSFEPMDPSILELSSEMEKSLGPVAEPPLVQDEPVRWGEPLQIDQPVRKEKPIRMEEPRPVPPAPVSVPDTLEKLETQLLSLEWEITRENLERTSREVLALKEGWGGAAEASPVLELMERVLNLMIHQGENISPRLINFLMDAKETVKLLIKQSTDNEMKIYGKLAVEGLEARFLCLERSTEVSGQASPRNLAERVDPEKRPMVLDRPQEELSNKMNSYYERLEETLQRIDHRLSSLGEWTRKAPAVRAEVMGTAPVPLNVTVFKVDGRFFGVPSEKVFKLFRIPEGMQDRLKDLERIHLQGMDVKVVELSKLFSIQRQRAGEESRMLIVKHEEAFKGLLIERVLQKVSSRVEPDTPCDEYSTGIISWKYQDQRIDVPILNTDKL